MSNLNAKRSQNLCRKVLKFKKSVMVDILEYARINKMLQLLSSVIFIQFVCISVLNFLPRLFRVPHHCTVSYGCKGQVDIVNCYLVETPLSIVIPNKFLLVLLVLKWCFTCLLAEGCNSKLHLLRKLSFVLSIFRISGHLFPKNCAQYEVFINFCYSILASNSRLV